MPLGFGRNLCWARMTSNASPVTPTLPQRRAGMPRTPCSLSLDSMSALVAGDSDGFGKAKLSDAEIPACKAAIEAISRKLEMPASIDEEFFGLSPSSKRDDDRRLTAAASDAAYHKNRYVNVLPFDDTRVILQRTKESDSDYINASFIESPAYGYQFIATQGPLPTTVKDFWEMVVQQKCSAIIMLTSLLDGSEEKCASYFPSAVNRQQVHGRLRVTNRGQTVGNHSIVKRVFEVQSVESSHEPPWVILHLEYLKWPDHGVPDSTRPIRELYRCVSSLPQDAGSVVVHCSAGIGRSGTYIAIDQTLRRILKGDLTAVDLRDTVIRLRDQRMGMVQTKAQYHFVYAAVLQELEELLKPANTDESQKKRKTSFFSFSSSSK